MKQTRLFIDHDYAQFFTLEKIYDCFIEEKKAGMTEAKEFSDYLINVTSKNGTVTEVSHLILCANCLANGGSIAGLQALKISESDKEYLLCDLCAGEFEQAALVKVIPDCKS